MATAEQRARENIDRLLTAAGWSVQDFKQANIHAARGVAIREFPLNAGFGFADYLLYVDGKAAGVIEAKKQGATLTGVEIQSGTLRAGPARQPARLAPPAALRATSPPASRPTSPTASTPSRAPATSSPSTARRRWREWLNDAAAGHGAQHRRRHTAPAPSFAPATFLARVRAMPELVTEWGDHKLWPAQITAIRNLEKSLAAEQARAR